MSSGLNNLHKIRLIAFDIDGVFTDGRFYLSDDGVETKAFHTQDGYGVRRLLDAGMAVGVISGRSSSAVERRMAELGVQHVILGCKDKVAAMDELAAALNISIDRLRLCRRRPSRPAFAGTRRLLGRRCECDAGVAGILRLRHDKTGRLRRGPRDL